ncbi:MAG: transglycosylase SLT domain-containing protein [candidate division Zixibacteria bacterium]|nr:transglycosylase SLT domain-containing protein [candidate division Zixibacteria bacterium]
MLSTKKIFRKTGITLSLPVTFILILIWLAQTAGLVYLLYQRGERDKILHQQEQKIKELEEKLKILKIIEDFQVGFKEEEVLDLTQVIYSESRKYGYDPLLILSLILTESSFRKWQESYLGAQGLMQVKPSVGEEIARRRGLQWKGELSLFEPAFNIQLGTLYLFELILKFKDVKKAIIAYNLGENAFKLRVQSGEKLPTYFLARVLKQYKELKKKYG